MVQNASYGKKQIDSEPTGSFPFLEGLTGNVKEHAIQAAIVIWKLSPTPEPEYFAIKMANSLGLQNQISLTSDSFCTESST